MRAAIGVSRQRVRSVGADETDLSRWPSRFLDPTQSPSATTRACWHDVGTAKNLAPERLDRRCHDHGRTIWLPSRRFSWRPRPMRLPPQAYRPGPTARTCRNPRRWCRAISARRTLPSRTAHGNPVHGPGGTTSSGRPYALRAYRRPWSPNWDRRDLPIYPGPVVRRVPEDQWADIRSRRTWSIRRTPPGTIRMQPSRSRRDNVRLTVSMVRPRWSAMSSRPIGSSRVTEVCPTFA
jgi:hypothetical protein